MTPVRALSVASEVFPLIKTGGLADVAGALPPALTAEGIATRTLVPGYPAVLSALQGRTDEVLALPTCYGGPARVLGGSVGDLDLFVLDAPHLFARPGNPYVMQDGTDWPDNVFRFAALGRVAADIGQGAIPAFVPDVVHAHDWQAGLTPAFLHYSERPRPGTIITVHNLAYPGKVPQEQLGEIGLPAHAFTMDGVEFYGGIGFLKAGLRFADRITTVSPTYAREIQQPDAGMGLDGLLRGRADVLSGILNGIDISVWNPQTDIHIAQTFSATRLADRAVNKAALQRRFGLPLRPDACLLGVVSRLSWQKGLDLLADNLPLIVSEGMQLVLLGSGEHQLQELYRGAANTHPEQIGVVIGYDEDLAHLIQAGSDALVVPSRFEPCGLTQLCALRYGAVPIVSRVGGLADTVTDANDTTLAETIATGVQFAPVTSGALADALQRAHLLFHDKPVWQKLQTTAVSVDVSWRTPARQYAELYREVARAQ
jgi:starch synthase